MIKVIEALYDCPLFLPCLMTEIYRPGMLVEFSGNFLIPSRYGRPFGIVAEGPHSFGLLPILFDSMLLLTDQYDLTCEYEEGAWVFGGKYGKMTSEKLNENSIPIGKVVSWNRMHQELEVSWI